MEKCSVSPLIVPYWLPDTPNRSPAQENEIESPPAIRQDQHQVRNVRAIAPPHPVLVSPDDPNNELCLKLKHITVWSS
jgi:hypothetical protein